jgi:hypothetical protein
MKIATSAVPAALGVPTGDHWHLAIALDGLAIALHQAGEADEARQHWAEALRLLAPYEDAGPPPCALVSPCPWARLEAA